MVVLHQCDSEVAPPPPPPFQKKDHLLVAFNMETLDCEPVKRKNSPDAEFQQQVHTP